MEIKTTYSPCIDCMNRYGRTYSKECVNICDYAHYISIRDTLLEDKDKIIQKIEQQLSEEKSRVAALIARNARLNYDLEYAYQTISKLRGDN